MTEAELKQTFGLTFQQFYFLREKYIYPCLQDGGPNGGRLFSHEMTPDSLTALLLIKMRELLSDRLLGIMFGESAARICKWLNRISSYIFENDDWLIRGRNLSHPQNLTSVLEEAHRATNQNERAAALYNHLLQQGQPNDKLVVLVWDTIPIKIQRVGNHSDQRALYSTKIKGHALTRLEACDLEGRPVFNHTFSASTSPTATDEATCFAVLDHKLTNNIDGGLKTQLLGLPGYSMVHLFDHGFAMHGFQPAAGLRPSFTDLLIQQQHLFQNRFHFFLPTNNASPVLD